MGGFIPLRGFELQHNLAGPGAAQPFVAEGRARDVATQAFEGLPLMGATTRVGSYISSHHLISDRSLGFVTSFLTPWA